MNTTIARWKWMQPIKLLPLSILHNTDGINNTIMLSVSWFMRASSGRVLVGGRGSLSTVFDAGTRIRSRPSDMSWHTNLETFNPTTYIRIGGNKKNQEFKPTVAAHLFSKYKEFIEGNQNTYGVSRSIFGPPPRTNCTCQRWECCYNQEGPSDDSRKRIF
jgi:hypothetical protein